MLLTLLSLAGVATAHSWVEQMRNIAPNGTFVGKPGYARDFISRDSPGWSDSSIVYEISTAGGDVPTDTPMCKDNQQSPNQNDGFPRLQAQAGSLVALRYQENGHVTQPNIPEGKPKGGGLMYVYGTTQPLADEKLLGVHKQWTEDGTGGDKRGVLLATTDFDDGRCYQINNSPISTQRQAEFPHQADQLMGVNMWCQMDIALPTDAPSGQPYTLYWVWDWPTEGQGAHPQLYTTCMDVDIQKSGADAPGQQKIAKANYAQGQDLNNAAIPEQLAKLNPPSVAGGQGSGPQNAGGQSVGSSSPTTNSTGPTTASAGESTPPPVVTPPNISLTSSLGANNGGSAQATTASSRTTTAPLAPNVVVETQVATFTETFYMTRTLDAQPTGNPNQRRSLEQGQYPKENGINVLPLVIDDSSLTTSVTASAPDATESNETDFSDQDNNVSDGESPSFVFVEPVPSPSLSAASTSTEVASTTSPGSRSSTPVATVYSTSYTTIASSIPSASILSTTSISTNTVVIVTATTLRTTLVLPSTAAVKTLTTTFVAALPSETASTSHAEMKREDVSVSSSQQANTYRLRGRNAVFARPPVQDYSIPRPPTED